MEMTDSELLEKFRKEDEDNPFEEDVRVEIIEDYRSYTGRLIAAKGRKGYIFRYYRKDVGKSEHIPVALDGNTIRRDVAAWKIKLI
jgi:hypothetical protein